MELDGRPVDAAQLLPLATTNLGHFTSMRAEDDGTVRGFSLHLSRLDDDCRQMFGVGVGTERVRGLVRRVIEQTTGPQALRVTVYDPALTMGVVEREAQPHVLVTTSPAGAVPTSPLRCKTYRFTRDMPQIKHTGLLSQVLRRRQARLDGWDDALFVEPGGDVCEGATWTGGFIDSDGALIWPLGPTLAGTTMQLLQKVHESRTEVVTLDDLPRMRAAFASNVSFGVRPISRIDAHTFATDDPVLASLRQAYAEIPGEVV